MAQVTLNPSIDTYINNAAPTTNFNGVANWIGERNDSATVRRTLIKFDLSSIPAGSTINTAVFRLWIDNDDRSDNARTARVYRLKRIWGEGTATWNTYDGSNSWQTAGATGANDIDTTEIGTASYTSTEAQGYKSYTLTASKIQEMIDGIFINNGWLVKMDTENNDAYAHSNKEGVNTANQPELIIDYTAPVLSSGMFLTF